jgi:hypothetical protein
MIVIITFIVVFIAGIKWQQSIARDMNPLKTDRWFIQQELAVTYGLFDLGVADINNDGWLDIYTANHSGRQIILLNNKGQEFTEQLSKLRLPQSYQVSEEKVSETVPSIKAPGLYIYWHSNKLVIHTKGMGDLSKYGSTGYIFVPTSVMPVTSGNLSITHAFNMPVLGKMLEFTAKGDGDLTIKFSWNQDFFFKPSLKLNSRLNINQIYVGFERLQPNSHDFALAPIDALPHRDRHGMAWTDWDGNGALDVLIVRGGMAGMMKELAPDVKDEFFIQNNYDFKDRIAELGIIKDSCSARQVAWVDFDGDNQLDIYIVCGRDLPPNSLQPNQLHRHSTEGRFINVAVDKNLALLGDGSFVWLDADNDRDMDLFWADETSFWLYVNQLGQFKPQLLDQHLGKINQLTISDYDSDGDFDVFAASNGGNTLFTNIKGKYKSIKPQSVGLPGTAFAANWVDYDNDGLIDLHVLPNGVYRQRSDHRFEATHLLETTSPRFGNSAFCTWFDADNDGSLDLLMGKLVPHTVWEKLQARFQDQSYEDSQKWKVMLYRNVSAKKNHWLQLHLIGSQGNQPAIGSKLKVLTPNGVQLQQVGQAEGSRNSQGHYRLYFGLGQNKSVDAMQIVWPDKHVQEIKYPTVDQLMIVQQKGEI